MTKLSSEKYVSASKVILGRGLQKVTLSHQNEFGICQVVRQMATRFANIEKSVLAIATFLDPRFKKIPITNEGSVERMSQQILCDDATFL